MKQKTKSNEINHSKQKTKINETNENKEIYPKINKKLRSLKEDLSFLEKKTLRNEEIIIDKMNEVKVSRIGQDKYISNILKENLNITVKVIYIDDTETSKTTQKFVTIF